MTDDAFWEQRRKERQDCNIRQLLRDHEIDVEDFIRWIKERLNESSTSND